MSSIADARPLALVGKPVGNVFPVMFLPDNLPPGDSKDEVFKNIRDELNFYLVEKKESDPWVYAVYHCGTAGNMYGHIHWTHCPGTLESQLFEMYSQEALGSNPTCEDCGKVSAPFSFWHIGEQYSNDPHRLLFVGKTSRNDPSDTNKSGIYDARQRACELFFNSPWPFWSYIRAILEDVFGNPRDGWDCVALTDLVKCNKKDKTTKEMRQNCLTKKQVFQKELSILQPKLIVFVTGTRYDSYLRDLKVENCTTIDAQEKRENGNRTFPWWVRQFVQNDLPVRRFLRIPHPQYQDKKGYVGKVAEWIRAAAF